MDFDELPDLVLEIVFSYLNQYGDLENVRLVSRRWHRIACTIINILKKSFFRCNQLIWELYVAEKEEEGAIAKRCSHSGCYHDGTKKVYIFGGCTDNYTAFNDLWSFDLKSRSWCREFIKCAPFPRPKAMSIFVPYKEFLILHGGFSKSSPNPIHQAANFFSEIHMYDTIMNQWVEIETTPPPPVIASHCACVVDDSLIIFGGSQNSRATNAVYILDIISRTWHMPSFVENHKNASYGKLDAASSESPLLKSLQPNPRYGSSCVVIDKSHLLVVGGCGGPNCIYNDAWLLTFDLTLRKAWEWKQVNITNPKSGPSQLWCHPACAVGRNLACISYARKSNGYSTVSLNSCPAPLQVTSRNSIQLPPRPANNVTLQSACTGYRNNLDPTLNEKLNSSGCQLSTSSLHTKKQVLYIFKQLNPTQKRDEKIDFSVFYFFLEHWYHKRRLGNACVYILDTARVLEDCTVTWRQQEIDPNSPDDTMLYSLCAGRGELIMFGGMRSDMQGDNRHPFTHTISNDIYVLSPARLV
uniref:F-box domain-containing protein n=1 Tax=Elaeophora elaphi TaxID=1147741 RepID=A0A0R3S530_9BILA